MKEPRAGSRKASIFAAYNSKGIDHAFAVGVKAGVKIGSIRGWLRRWGADIKALAATIKKHGYEEQPAKPIKPAAPAKKKRKAAELPVQKPKPKPKPDDASNTKLKNLDSFTPDFRYKSRHEATEAARGREKLAGLKRGCLQVAYHNGRYAIIPIHLFVDLKKPPPTFEVGRRVRNMVGSWKGVIKEAGPEQSMVAYDNGIQQYVSNHYLVKLKPKAGATVPVVTKAKPTKAKPAKAKPKASSKQK